MMIGYSYLYKHNPNIDWQKKKVKGRLPGTWIHALVKSVKHEMYVRATGHKTPGESSVNITVSVYDTTHLQENPQRIG